MKNEKISAPWHKNRNVCRVSKKQKRKNANKKFSFLLLFFSSFSSSSSPLFSFFFLILNKNSKLGGIGEINPKSKRWGLDFIERADAVRMSSDVLIRWRRLMECGDSAPGGQTERHSEPKWNIINPHGGRLICCCFSFHFSFLVSVCFGRALIIFAARSSFVSSLFLFLPYIYIHI